MDNVALGFLVIGTLGYSCVLLIIAALAGRRYPSSAKVPAIVAAAGTLVTGVFQGLGDLGVVPRTPLYYTAVLLPLAVALVAMWKMFAILRTGTGQSK